MVTYTPNKGYAYPAHGAEVNNWDAYTNQIFTDVDLNVGGTNTTAASTATIGITLAQGPGGTAQYLQQRITGTLGANIQLVFLSTDLGGAYGGIWVISNETTGSFTLTAITTSSTNSGVVVAQGGRTTVVSDGTNVNKADSNVVAKVYTYLGNPTGSVAATVATANGGVTDMVWDGTYRQMYMPMITAIATASVYTALAPLPSPQGYLTTVSNTPIINSNQTVSTIYYTPYVGGWTTLPTTGGTSYFPYNFTQLSISMSALGANNIYDAYMAYLSSVGVFCGMSPSWTVGGGSITAGSGARGTGAGSAALTRAGTGMYVNSVAMSLVNGGTTYTVAAGAAQYLGSVYTASAGSVSCLPAYGQSRVWGIWNAFNKNHINISVGDATSSWAYTSSSTTRPSNGSSNNVGTSLCGLAEENIYAEFTQRVFCQMNSGLVGNNGIGVNSTNSFSGQVGIFGGHNSGGTAESPQFNTISRVNTVPTLGINNYYCLERGISISPDFFGTETYMKMTVQWDG